MHSYEYIFIETSRLRLFVPCTCSFYNKLMSAYLEDFIEETKAKIKQNIYICVFLHLSGHNHLIFTFIWTLSTIIGDYNKLF